jgi:hypothetical protein
MAAFHPIMMIINEKLPSRLAVSVELLKVIGWTTLAFILEHE